MISPKEKKEVAKAWGLLSASEREEYVDFAIEEMDVPEGESEAHAYAIFTSDWIELKKQSAYRRGPKGMIRWIEDKLKFKVPVKTPDGIVFNWVWAKDLPGDEDEYGRSYKTLWEHGKKVLTEALQMKDGEYRHKLLVFCWPRGDGKSFLSILIALHRFFCLPNQRIYLSSPSKGQSDDTLLGEMKELIQNSPELMAAVGKKGILGETIRMTKAGVRYNFIKLITGPTGLRSNASLVIQTEVLDMESDAFFAKWYGSLRNNPNTMGILDTTVSGEDHWLYKKIYKDWLDNPASLTYFSYRYSKSGHPKDYVHPGMTKVQIADYKGKLSSYDFRRFFLNSWKHSSDSVVSGLSLTAMGVAGIDGKFVPHKEVMKVIRMVEKGAKQKAMMLERMARGDNADQLEGIDWSAEEKHKGRIWPFNELLDLGTELQVGPTRVTSTPAKLADINRLSQIYQTNWALLVGIDMSDALKSGTRMKARTIMTWQLKGLPNSLRMKRREMEEDPRYLYIFLGIADFLEHQPSDVNSAIRILDKSLGGVQMVSGETYGLAHIAKYCKSLSIPLTVKHPSTQTQNVGFTEFLTAIDSGRFKAPTIPLSGMKADSEDILREEIGVFNVVANRGGTAKYGSPFKKLRHGVQDDVIDSIGWGQYGGLGIQAQDFKPRRKSADAYWGEMFSPSLVQSNFVKATKRAYGLSGILGR